MGASVNIPLPYNPAMFRWARERLAIPVDEAAAKVSVAAVKLTEWEMGEAAPTVRQGRMLADAYGRHFLEFFAPHPPALPEVTLVPDFRSFANTRKTARDEVNLRAVQEWAEEVRGNTLALLELIGEQAPVLTSNLKFALSDNAETAAGIVREAMSFQLDEQTSLKSDEAYTLPGIIRRKIEQLGVLVLKQSGITKLGVRGICLFADPLPTIVFGNEAPGAQAFTLVHELGHVLLRQSGISGAPGGWGSGSANIEGWCNRFAASFLAPKDAIAEALARPDTPSEQISLGVLATLAKKFWISRHAMLIRLIDLGYVSANFYWKVMRPIFTKEEEEYKSFGRPPYYGKRFVGSRGEYYTSLVLEAWAQRRITAHNAAEYMGIDNLSHLIDIREDFLG